MASFCFIVTVKITNQNQEFFIKRCIDSIRRIYPDTPIIIAKSPDTVCDLPSGKNIRIEENPYYSTFGALYLFYKHRYADYAYILHDSMCITRQLPDPTGDIRFLYWFGKKDIAHNHYRRGYEKLLPTTDVDRLMSTLSYGCFGCSFLIRHSCIEKTQLLDILPNVQTKYDFEAMERIVAYLSIKHGLIDPEIALCGDIFESRVNPWTNGLTYASLDDILRLKFPQPIFKSIVSRI